MRQRAQKATNASVARTVADYREYYRFYYTECVALPQPQRRPFADTLRRLQGTAQVERECLRIGQ